MPDTLDTLAAKADALECMRVRGDAGYQDALALYRRELAECIARLQAEALTAFGINLNEGS